MNFKQLRVFAVRFGRVILVASATTATLVGGLTIWLASRQRVPVFRAALAIGLIAFASAAAIPLALAIADPRPELPVMIWSLRHLGDLPGYVARWSAFRSHDVLGVLAFVLAPLCLAMAALLLNWPRAVSHPIRRVHAAAWAFLALAALGSSIAEAFDLPWIAGGWLGAGLSGGLRGLMGGPGALAVSSLSFGFLMGRMLEVRWSDLGKWTARVGRQGVLSADRIASRGAHRLKDVAKHPAARAGVWLKATPPRFAEAIKSLDTPLPRPSTALDGAPLSSPASVATLRARLSATRDQLRRERGGVTFHE